MCNLEARGRGGKKKKKNHDEFDKYMEHRKLSLLDSRIFTENDGVDSAPAIALPGVRDALFGGVLLQRGGGRGGGPRKYGDHPDLRLFWGLGLCYLGECGYVGQEKEGEKRKVTFVHLFILMNGVYLFILEWKS